MGITDTAIWRAVYKDGSNLSERDTDGKDHAFGEIDLDNLELFQLVNAQNIPICQVRMGEGKRLIWARRNQMVTGRRLVQQGEVKVPLSVKSHQRVIIIGWQKTINGVNSKAIFYLMPDGRIEMDDEWREDALHDKVNTPGLHPEPESRPKGRPSEKKSTSEVEKDYSKSNDTAFENKP